MIKSNHTFYRLKNYGIWLVLFFLFTITPCLAQLPVYKNFIVTKNNHPVRLNTVYTLSNGFMLAGTEDGLYKFDGENFSKIFFSNKDYNDTVTAIFEDHQKKVWVGFLSGRLAHLINNKLFYYNPEEGTPQKKITAIQQDKENKIWYAAYGEGIYYIKNNRHYLINASNGLTDLNISTLAITQQGDILAGTDQGLQICRIKNGKTSVEVIGPSKGLPDYIVTSITAAGQNRFWIGLQENGFCLYDHSLNKITIPPAAKNWQQGQVNNILPDGDKLWIASNKDVLITTGNAAKEVSPGLNKKTSGIKQFIKDAQGNIWMLNPDNGLTRTAGKSIKLFELYPPEYYETIHAILNDRAGNIWINDDMAITRYTNQQGDYISKRYPIPGLEFNYDITALFEDPFANIWIGTMGKGIFILNPATGAIRHMADKSMIENTSVLSLSGYGNTLFISSLQGAYRIDLNEENKNISAPYSVINISRINTNANFIYCIYKDKKERLWYGTDGMGLIVEEKGSYRYYNDEKLIKDRHIYSITADDAGNTWFSTASAGIYKFDGKHFTNYGLAEGLSSLEISVIKKIKSGHIVAVNKLGIDIINPTTGTVSYLNNHTGLAQINADNPGAVAVATDGSILITGKTGIVSFSIPEHSSQQPFTKLESVQLFLKETDTTASRKFSHDENNFNFIYTGLYYTDPTHIYYRYKLEGLDSNWVITSDRNKTFSRLAPGSYTFRIQSSLNTNFTHAHEASYHFIIKQAFYTTWWFLSGMLLLISAGVYWYIKSREKELKKIQALRQEKMQFQFELLRNQVNPHFLFNSFNTLISSIEDDPQMAVSYAEQLSDFFRNMIAYRDKEIITLKEEIILLENYFFLQQKRYGQNLRMELRITEDQKKHFNIPPLTLQLLAENAIKHNIVSSNHPLTLSLTMHEDGNLSVSNNKNKRSSQASGTGMGLENIAGRFKILTGKPIQISDEAEMFVVKLPLIKNQHD